jgi:polysaccharide deacetylase 2 family uncharacterized protein YibQ
MANDLGAPLGLRPVKRSWWRRIPFGLIGVLVLALVATIGGIWITVIRDPMGGQPTAVATIDRTKTGIGRADVAVSVADEGKTPKPAEPDKTAAPPSGAPAGETTALRRAPEAVEGQPLPTQPIARVTEKGRYGLLPRIASDGSRPFDVYARPAKHRPQATGRVAMIVGGLGLSQTTTQEALRVLPPDVTLAFAPYGSSLDRWVQNARSEGHELLLQLPMEPFDYPDNDPGPHTLLTSVTPEINADRLDWLMSRITNYVGVVNYQGAKFTAGDPALTTVLRTLAGRGVMYVDDGASSRSTAEAAAQNVRLPFARGDVTIDVVPNDDAIEARLAQLEQVARARGSAVGLANALPITLRHLQSWAKGLESRGMVLVPVSAVVGAPPG